MQEYTIYADISQNWLLGMSCTNETKMKYAKTEGQKK